MDYLKVLSCFSDVTQNTDYPFTRISAHLCWELSLQGKLY